MNKKTGIIILACSLVLILAVVGVVVRSQLPQPLNYPIDKIEAVGTQVQLVSKDAETVTLQTQSDAPFRILMFTDMHLDGKNETSYQTVDRMVKSIREEKPDLVLLGGDNVTSAFNRKRSAQLAEIFEKLGVYWGGVIGNHEGDNKYSISREEMVGIFTGYEHCVMLQGPEEIDGNCNYAINILNGDGSLRETIFCLDTFDEIGAEQRASHEIIEDKSPYDGAHENQVQWYREKAASLKETYGDYKSILLMHIPLPAFDKAVETEPLLYGEKNEGICSTVYENGLFEAIKEAGVTQAVFCGHDHINSFGVEYQGVILSYIESSGYGAYGLKKKGVPEEDWLQGYTRLDVDPDGSYSHTQIRYAEVFGVE